MDKQINEWVVTMRKAAAEIDTLRDDVFALVDFGDGARAT